MSVSLLTAGVQIPSGVDAPLRFDFDLHALRIAMVSREGVRKLDAESWDQPGVYVLLGGVAHGAPLELRVGQAVQLRSRLLQHVRQPPLAWWRAVAVIRDTHAGFNSAEIGYLEGRLASELRERPGVVVVEGKRDHDTTLPTYARTSLDAFVETILEALKVAGLTVASPADEGSSEEETVGPSPARIPGTVADLLAAGLLSAGDRLEAARTGRATGETKRLEAEVLATGNLLMDGVSYRSPSQAAIKGFEVAAANGWTTWRVAGRQTTLAELRSRLEHNET
jgi:hypothetical protein